jgi:hypothetical protein
VTGQGTRYFLKDINHSEVDFLNELPFYPPGTDETIEEYTDCSDCHTGGKELYE